MYREKILLFLILNFHRIDWVTELKSMRNKFDNLILSYGKGME